MFVLSLILLFIIKLRFPASETVPRTVFKRYGSDGLSKFRRLEEADLKLRKVQADLVFLRTCVTNQLVPRFLQFKLHSKALRNENTYKTYQKKLLDREVLKKLEIKLSRAQALQNHKDQCLSIFSRLDYNHLTSFILRVNEKKAQSYHKKHSKKLFALGLEYQHKLLGPEDVIFNFSKHKLSEPEKDALSLGLKYCFNPIKLDYVDFFLSFEKLS